MKHARSLPVVGMALGLMGLSTAGSSAADFRQPAPVPLSFQKYFLHLGYSVIIPDESAVIANTGVVIPGATISLDNSYTAAVEAGYFFTPNWAVALAGGYPPTSNVMGAGTIAGLGSLGKVTGGTVELNAQYHFTNFGAFQPYVGVGPAALLVFDTDDGALTNLKVKNSVGWNFQVGADLMISKNIGVFVDLKKVFMSTTSTGTLGGQPITSDVKLDPMIIAAGLTIKY